MPQDRAITIESRAGDKLIVTDLVGHDEVSACFAFSLSLAGSVLDVKPETMLGHPLAIELEFGRSAALAARHRQRVPARQGRGAPRLLCRRAPALELAPRAHGRLPDLPEPQRRRDRRGDLRQVPRGALREAARRQLCAAGILRPVRRDRPRLRAAPARARGDLLFLRVCRGRRHPGADRQPRQAEAGARVCLGAVPPGGRPGPPRPRLPVGLGGDELDAYQGLRPHRLRLREAGPVADGPVRGRAAVEGFRRRALPPAGSASRGRPRRQNRRPPPRGAAGAARADRGGGDGARAVLGLQVRPQGASARGSERRLPGAPRRLPVPGSGVSERRHRHGRRHLPGGAGGGAARTALPAAAADPAAGDARAADGDRRRAGRRGDLHRQVCPGEGAVPLGPRGQARREHHLLHPRLPDVGGRRLGLHPDPSHRAGGDRRLHRGRPRPADHYRAGLQRGADAALRPAGKRHPVRLEVEFELLAAAGTTS